MICFQEHFLDWVYIGTPDPLAQLTQKEKYLLEGVKITLSCLRNFSRADQHALYILNL
jgi:hypothetical protein